MFIRILLIVALVVVVLAVPAAFLLGRHQTPPSPGENGLSSVNESTVTTVTDESVSDAGATSSTKSEDAGGDLFSGLVAAVSDRVVDESRRIVDHTVDEVTARLEQELDVRLDKGRKELDRASRKLGDDLDHRSDSLTRTTAEQSERLAEQSETIAKTGRTSADAINRTATDLRTLVATSVTTVNTEADQAKAKLVKVVKDSSARTQKLVGKTGVALPGTSTRISSEIASNLTRWLDEVDATRVDFQKRTTTAHQRFTDAVNKAQVEAESQRQKAFALVQSASETLRSQVATAERELTEAVKKAEAETDQALARVLGKAEQKPENRPVEPARRGGK